MRGPQCERFLISHLEHILANFLALLIIKNSKVNNFFNSLTLTKGSFITVDPKRIHTRV